MSYLFEIDDDPVFGASNRVAVLFVDMLEAAGKAVRRPTGLEALAGGWFRIDPDAFGEFVQELLAVRARSTHQFLWLLLDGVLPLAVTLLERSGRTVVPATDDEGAYLDGVRELGVPLPG
ncbi:DUF6086 family protein [Streptomyces sp. NPDC093225]|uniref:DUF6086 family protein n=1 Tax=Streptomyces sp. NPDC093225 TaxID=3366034 RepID=UPI0038174511